MPGISRPILWKSSPRNTEIAIISRCIEGEQSLAQRYLQIPPNSKYTPPSVPDICALAIKVVQVLEQIHLKKVRHGSLRPDVIGVWFVNGEPQVCLRDFTESRLLGESKTPVDALRASEMPSLNITPSICVHYISPETIGGNPSSSLLRNDLNVVDHRSDFYSLGAILHELLTGKPLFSEYLKGEVMTAEIALEIATAHRFKKPVPPTAGRETLLDELVLHLLAKVPNMRYRTGLCPGVMKLIM